MLQKLQITAPAPGLHEITNDVSAVVLDSGVQEGLCTLFLRHTSASLLIQENADPSARRDLEAWLDRLVPERDPLFTHTSEGLDDMPAHIKTALTASSLSVPISEGRMVLGTWQGIYLWEHRRPARPRQLVVQVQG
jgi:secondary thiamine-phosphate synthase enzyme